MDFRRSVLSSIKWSAIEGFGQKAIDALLFFLLARLLGPENLGLVAIAGMFVALLEPFCRLGLDVALIQRRQLEPQHVDTAFWLMLGASLLAASVAFLSAGSVAALFDEPELAGIIRWIALGVALRGLIAVQDAQFRRALDYRPLAVRALSATVIGGIVGVACAVAGLGPYSLVAQGLTGSIVSLVLIWTLSAWRPSFRFSLRHAAELMAFGRSVFGFSLLRIYNWKSPGLFTGYFLGPAAAAYFALADRLFFLLITVITQSLNRVSVPMFSRIQDDPARLWGLFLKATSLVALISFPAYIGLALVAPEVILLLLGTEWQESIVPIQILMIAGLSGSVSFFNGSLLVGIGRPELRFYAAGIRAIAGTLLFSVAHVWGLAGMAVAYLLRALISEPTQLLFVSRTLPTFTWGAYLRGLGGALSAALVMAAAVLYVASMLPASLNAATIILIEILVGIGAYAVANLATNRQSLASTLRLVRSVRSVRSQ